MKVLSFTFWILVLVFMLVPFLVELIATQAHRIIKTVYEVYGGGKTITVQTDYHCPQRT